jgi:hypothetical protein
MLMERLNVGLNTVGEGRDCQGLTSGQDGGDPGWVWCNSCEGLGAQG